MAIQDNISIETRFQLNNTTKNFKITDDTDYAAEGIATTDVIGALVIKDPSGTTIHSTLLPLVDIDVDVQDYIDSIALSLDANGDVVKGNYTIIYSITVSGGVQPGTYSKTFVYNFCYKAPKAVIDVTVDLINAKLTSVDNTAYPSDMTSSALTHTIYPPRGVNPTTYPPKVVATATNFYSPIFTKTWTATISNVIEVTYADNLIVDDTITGNIEKDVKDDINICNLQCNLRALGDRYNTALTNNPVNADKIAREQLTPALFNAFMYTSNIQCGSFDKAEEYYRKVLEFTGSQPDCQCSNSDTPTLITASGGSSMSGTFVVDVSGVNNALSVTSNTIGDTTTYTMLFNNTIFNKISALTETSVTSADGSVTVVPTTPSGYLKNYDLSVPVQEALYVEVLMTFNKGNLPTYSIVTQKKYGSKFKTLTDTGFAQFLEIQNLGSVNDWGNNYVSIKMQNFFSGSAVNYYPQVDLIKEYPVFKTGIESEDKILSANKKFTPEIYVKNTSDSKIKLINNTQYPALGIETNTVSQITLIFKIHA